MHKTSAQTQWSGLNTKGFPGESQFYRKWMILIFFFFYHLFCRFYFKAFYLKAHLSQILSCSLSWRPRGNGQKDPHICRYNVVLWSTEHVFIKRLADYAHSSGFVNILIWGLQHTCFRTRLRICDVLAMDCVYAERTQLTFSGGYPSTYLSSYGGAFSWFPLMVLGRCPLLSSTWKEQFKSYFYCDMSIYLHSPKIKLKVN